jgi:hypothetical protein
LATVHPTGHCDHDKPERVQEVIHGENNIIATPNVQHFDPPSNQSDREGYLSRRRTLTRLPYRILKRLLNGALLGNCGTFSILIPQSGHHTR